MTWLIIAIGAYFLLALVNLADKFMVDKIIPHPKTYAFLVSVGGLIVVLAAPWGLAWPGFRLWMINISVGASFTAGLVLLYKGLKRGEASQVFTMVGGLVPVFTFIFSILFLGDNFTLYQILALLFLILGTVLIVWLPVTHSIWGKTKVKLGLTKEANKKQAINLSILTAMMFAIFWVGSKYVYNTQEFLSGFIWIRVGSFLAAMSFLITAAGRKEIKDDLQKSNSNSENKFIFLATQGLAATGSIMQNYAVSLASVAIVTALQGLQYAFLLAFSALVGIFSPNILKENNSPKIWTQKIIAVFLISLGLYFLAKF